MSLRRREPPIRIVVEFKQPPWYIRHWRWWAYGIVLPVGLWLFYNA
jgi:hypothetical protein